MCQKHNGDAILSVILTTSFAIYITSAFAMGLILGLIVFKRGHWVAMVLTLAYTVAYCLKGLSFENWFNEGEGIA